MPFSVSPVSRICVSAGSMKSKVTDVSVRLAAGLNLNVACGFSGLQVDRSRPMRLDIHLEVRTDAGGAPLALLLRRAFGGRRKQRDRGLFKAQIVHFEHPDGFRARQGNHHLDGIAAIHGNPHARLPWSLELSVNLAAMPFTFSRCTVLLLKLARSSVSVRPTPWLTAPGSRG